MMQRLFSTSARFFVLCVCSGARLFVQCVCIYAHSLVRSVRPSARVFVHCVCILCTLLVRSLCPSARAFVRSGSRVFVHCVCILCTLLSLSSCEKAITDEDSVVSGSPADKDANLTVTVFSIEKTPFGTLAPGAYAPATRAATRASATRAATPASEACTRLNFAIYDEGGSRVKQVNQTSAEADFGKASFQLAEGDYLLVVVGHSSNGNPTMTDPTKVQFTNATGYTDTYLCCANVTIGEEKVDYNVSLDRITALCRFVLTDTEIPSEVKKMRFYYTGGSGAFNAQTGLGCVNSKQDVKFDVSDDHKQFDLYTFLHDTEGTIHLTVSALDASGVEITQRDFDVPMQQNYITWLSGPFFGDSGSGSTTITGVTINTDWAGETHITF